MKKITTIFFSSLLFTSLALVSAQNTASSSASTKAVATSASSMTVATVNIYNATSTKISTSTYSVSFQIFNRVGIQSNIRYGLEFVNAKTNEILDRKLSNEALTLGESDSKDLKMIYTIPGFIANGDYKLMIVAENQNALPLAYMPSGFPERTITVSTNYDNGLLGLDKCFVYVGDNQSKKYTLAQGVDTLNTEKLSVNCDIKNNSLKDFSNLKIQTITHKRDQFGDILGNSFVKEGISLAVGESQNLSFDLQTMSTPQAYDVDTFLVNADNQKVSPSMRVHYVIHGASATIQNTYLDKASYKKGEIANAKVFWSPSADSYPYSRLGATSVNYILSVNVRDQNKTLCGTASSTAKSSDSFANQNVKVSITKDCPNAVTTVSILNKDTGEVLDSTTIDLQNSTEKVNISPEIKSYPVNPQEEKNNIYLTMLVVVLGLILISYGILKLKGETVINK